MKTVGELIKEIRLQKKVLKEKGVTPRIVIVGSMAYFSLKTHPKAEFDDYDSNTNPILSKIEGLQVVQKPAQNKGDIFRPEHDKVEVYGD